jgi:hypothetical protein
VCKQVRCKQKKQNMKDLFEIEVEEKKLNPNFKIIKDSITHEGARKELNDVFERMGDVDGDLRKKFQTNGFDAMIWELYLYSAFEELDVKLRRNHTRPDFEIELKDNTIVFIEAGTSNPKENREPVSKKEIIEKLKNHTEFIRLGSILYSKLKKEYWKLDWVKEKPLVLAIAPFYHGLAQWLSDESLIDYLYGINQDWHHDDAGNLIITTNNQDVHEYEGKKIPSGFFGLEGAENISAVIFSNAGTISKFNRIGTQKGNGNNKVKLIRKGNIYDPNPNATEPIQFAYEVGDERVNETWSQELRMFHNPNAKYPINSNLIPEILHGFYEDGVFHSNVPSRFILQSETIVIMSKKE